MISVTAPGEYPQCQVYFDRGVYYALHLDPPEDILKRPGSSAGALSVKEFLKEIFSAGFQLQFNFFGEEIRIAERDRTLLGFYEYRKEAGVRLLYYPCALLNLAPAVGRAV